MGFYAVWIPTIRTFGSLETSFCYTTEVNNTASDSGATIPTI